MLKCQLSSQYSSSYETSEYYGIVSYFMEFHRDDLPEDGVEVIDAEMPAVVTIFLILVSGKEIPAAVPALVPPVRLQAVALPDRYGSEAYLFVPWDERYYQEMAEIIGQRFARWEALESRRNTRRSGTCLPFTASTTSLTISAAPAAR